MEAQLRIPDFNASAIDAQWQAVTGGYFLYRNTSTSDTMSLHLVSTGAAGTVTFLRSNIVNTSETIQQIKDKFVDLNNSEDEPMAFTVGTNSEMQQTNDINRANFLGIFVADTVASGVVKFYDCLN